MTNNSVVDNRIDDHRSHNQNLRLKITETRAVPRSHDPNLPHRKVRDITNAKRMTTIPRTNRTTTIGRTLTGLSHKTEDLRHSKRNEKSFGGNPNCTSTATVTTMIAPRVPPDTPQTSYAWTCSMRKTSESTIPVPKGLQISSLGNIKTY
jgi:hypothetical protein